MKTANLNFKANLYTLLYFVLMLIFAVLVSGCNPVKTCAAYDTARNEPLHKVTFLRDAAPRR